MERPRMLSRSSLTRRRYSSMLTWASHWKAVWGLGTKQAVDTVMVTPRLGLGVHSCLLYTSELRIAFADLGWETASLRNLSLLSLLVWALAMVGLFFVSLVLSSVALRPAERAWQQQRQFVADASHELKTPLTVILANTGLVLSHPEDTVAAQSKWLEYRCV